MHREFQGGGAKAKKAELPGRSSDLCFVEKREMTRVCRNWELKGCELSLRRHKVEL